MSKFINTYSCFFTLELKEKFEYNKNYIQNFLSLFQNFLEDKDNLKNNLKNYKELKSFIGKKRNNDDKEYTIEEMECKNNKKFFNILNFNEGISVTNLNNKDMLIFNRNKEEKDNKEEKKEEDNKEKKKEKDNKEKKKEEDNQNNQNKKFIQGNQEEKEKDNKENKIIKDIQENQNKNEAKAIRQIKILNEPILIVELFSFNLLNINLINDNVSLTSKYKVLDQYNYQIYTLGKAGKLIVKNDNDIIETDGKIKTLNLENLNIKPFLIIMNSQIPTILDSDLKLENIYHKESLEDIVNANVISKIFFYYFNISNELQKKYQYIKSENRIKMNNILEKFLYCSNKKILIIAGPKGIGKTASLIYFSFLPTYRTFYFNLEVFNNNLNDNNIKIKELKIQLTKLFGQFVTLDKSKIKELIEDYIEKNYNIDCLEFIYNIINLFLRYSNSCGVGSFCFIIDQFSLSFNDKKDYNINSIIELFKKNNNSIKLILCPTLNNIFAKTQINYLFQKSLNKEKNKDFDIYFFQELISKEFILKTILKDETNEYITFIEEFGYLPKYYYDSKYSNINNFKCYIKKNMKSNLDEYYISENNNKNNEMNKKLLELLDIVKGEKLICSSDFKKHIQEFPLKYLKIIKYKINKNIIADLSTTNNDDKNNKKKGQDILLDYLNFLLTISENNDYDEAINDYFEIEERKIELYFNDYIEKDKSSINIYGDYYQNFIFNNNTYFHDNEETEESIYVYKLEFSTYFFEDIIYEYLYNHIKDEYQFFSNIIDKGANGGFFEILVDFYIRSNKSFIVKDIKQAYYISSIVPQNYSIKYYSSKSKKNSFEKFVLKNKGKKKKKIPHENTYIRQAIFNSKYYDMAILIKTKDENDKNNNNFALASIQATTHKDKEKRMTKDEHELILGAAKENIENEFDIKIKKAYFLYVLSEKKNGIEDIDTKEDCKSKGISYIGFSIDSINNSDKFFINLEDALITDYFPSHNCASLLSYPKKNDSDYMLLKHKIDQNLKSSQTIGDEYYEKINKIIQNKYEPKNVTKEQFKYFDLKVGNIIKNYLTDFSFLIFTKSKKSSIGKKVNNKYIFAMNKTYELKSLEISNETKIGSNDTIMFCYSEVPLELINN